MPVSKLVTQSLRVACDFMIQRPCPSDRQAYEARAPAARSGGWLSSAVEGSPGVASRPSRSARGPPTRRRAPGHRPRSSPIPLRRLARALRPGLDLDSRGHDGRGRAHVAHRGSPCASSPSSCRCVRDRRVNGSSESRLPPLAGLEAFAREWTPWLRGPPGRVRGSRCVTRRRRATRRSAASRPRSRRRRPRAPVLAVLRCAPPRPSALPGEDLGAVLLRTGRSQERAKVVPVLG